MKRINVYISIIFLVLLTSCGVEEVHQSGTLAAEDGREIDDSKECVGCSDDWDFDPEPEPIKPGEGTDSPGGDENEGQGRFGPQDRADYNPPSGKKPKFNNSGLSKKYIKEAFHQNKVMEADFNRKYGDSGRVARLKNSASSMGAALSGVAAEVKQFQTNKEYSFKSDPTTKEGQDLRAAHDYYQFAQTVVDEDLSERQPARQEVLDFAAEALTVADQALVDGDKETGVLTTELAVSAVDISLSLTPGVGWAKDLYESVAGVGMVDNRKLTDVERGFAIFGVVTAGYGSKLLMGGKIFKALGNVPMLAGVVKRSRKVTGDLGTFITLRVNGTMFKA